MNNLDEINEKLVKLGREIETAKSNVSQLKGREVEIVNRLQENFKISTLEEVDVAIANITKELDALEGTIVTEFNELKETFEW